MEESKVADYFVITGLPDDPEPMDDYSDQSHLKQNSSLAPITDITVIFPGSDEYCPDGWECLEQTPTGLTANLNYGSMNSSEVFLCYRRGRDKPPLVDIGVLYENKDRILSDSNIVLKTPTGKSANINSTSRTFLTYRRAKEDMHANELVVTDICVIVASKGEKAPHAFCVIKKNLNRGIFGGEVYLCYKKSMNRAHVICYKPGILCRYPLWDRPDWKLHSNVPLFCLPMGASMELWPPEASQPPTVFSTFILTVSDAAEKVYGSAVTFYEKYPVEKLTEEQLFILTKSLENERKSKLNVPGGDDKTSNKSCNTEGDGDKISLSSHCIGIPGSYTVNVNKCICLLSHWPFFDTFETFLNFLYKLSTSGPHLVPIERYISHFLENVPFPSPQRPRILVELSAEESVLLFQPEDLPLPQSGAGFRDLLINLGPEDSLLVLLLVLTEHKILVHSLRPSILTAVVEAISMIIFPFKWQCPYIPLCPLGLAEVLHAPLPFLIGVDSRFFDLYDPPADVTCVDLDTNNITVSEERRNLSYKLLPKRAARNLKSALEEIHKKCYEDDYYRIRADEDVDGMMRFHLKEREQKLQLEIQEAFLRFMAAILKGYRSYLLPITKAPTVGTTDPSSLFDLQGFLKSRDRAHHKFFMMLMRTQMFIRFIEERSFVSDMDAGLAFFDECTEKVDYEDGYCRLLDFEESHKSERTVFIPPPEPVGLPVGATYVYEGFNLDNNLFRHREKRNSLKVTTHENVPGSPMARRTKHEVKSAQKLARRKHSQSAQSWAKCLFTTCYSLWFIHLPSFVLFDPSKASVCLKIAYDLLVKIQKLKLHPTDEVCYRVMMQLFGIHSQPVLAVNLLSQMKLYGIQPNALTYGYYNRAVLEATWPSDLSNPTHLWNKLRNVIVGAALFRRGGHRASRNRLPEAESCTSLASLDKGDLMSEFEVFDRKRSRLGSILKPHSKNLQQLSSHQPFESIAGILMLGFDKPIQEGKKGNISEFSPKLQQNSSVSSESNSSRLRRGSMSPTLSENKMLKILMRSDSFANDISIVEKHNRSSQLNEKNQLDLGISSTLSIPRESSESLDITDDFSLDESWNDGRMSVQNNCNDTPTKSLLSKLSRFGSDVWVKSHWKTSQESVDSVPVTLNERSPQKTNLPKTDSLNDGKLPSESSENASVSNSVPLLLDTELEKTEHSEEEDGSVSMKSNCGQDKGNSRIEQETMESVNSQTPEKPLRLDLPLNESNVSLSDRENEPRKTDLVSDKDELVNGEFPSSEGTGGVSPSKVSPVRVPVTENDPLGALQPDDLLNGDEKSGAKEEDQIVNSQENFKMKYDLERYGLFSNNHAPKKTDEGVEIKNKKNSKRNESEQGDGPAVGGGRVPKSATFHHGRDKDFKGIKGSKGYVAVEEDIISSRKVIQRSTTMPDAAAAVAVSSSPSVASSLSHLGSSLKFSFSRYSPSRFSLKKSDLRVAKTHILENAISGSKKSNELLLSGYNSFKSAASSIAKKIEEAISNNTTPVKSSNLSHEYEDDEIDLNTEKSSTIDFESWGTNLKELFGEGSRKGSSVNLQAHNLEEHTVPEEVIFDNLYGKNSSSRQVEGPVALAIVMTTCCKCNNCNSVLHDEEIIAGWTPDDSNLNTKCHFCEKSTLPFLSVSIYDYRRRNVKARSTNEMSNLSHSFYNWQLNSSNSSVNNASLAEAQEGCEIDRCKSEEEEEGGKNASDVSDRGENGERVNGEEKTVDDGAAGTRSLHCDSCVESDVKDNLPGESGGGTTGKKSTGALDEEFNVEPYLLEPINVPYLNPLVLRKELENILQHEGDPSLTKPSFVDQHPIIYWNMIWVFERINVVSHLPGLALKSSAVNKEQQFIHPSWKSKCEQSNVSIRCIWDNPRLHEEIGPPMYVLWQQQDPQSVLVNALITERIAFSKSVMQNVIDNLRIDNLCDPMRQLVNERKKLRKKGFSHFHSLYRDILFLAISACDRNCVDLDHFDREYGKAYEKLRGEGIHLLKCDKPPVSASYRNYFRPLLLSCALN